MPRALLVCGFSPYWGRIPPNVLDLEDGPTVGGGEENAIRCASGLADLGWEVDFYWYGEPGRWRGANFFSLADPLYSRIAGEHWDAVVAWSTTRPLMYAQPGTRRIFAQQLNDLAVPGDWNKVDVVVSPSVNHATMIYGWGWRGKRAVVHNGLDIGLYKTTPCNRERTGRCWRKCECGNAPVDPIPWEQRPYDVGYWSSPDRGLHHLLRAWPAIRKAEPRARLHVFYEIKRYLAIAQAAQNSYFAARGREIAYLIRDLEDDKSIIFHGAVPRRKLAAVQRQCRVQTYPYSTFAYCEGFAGAVNQGVAAGCLVATTPKDALPSLYGDSCYWMTKSDADLDFHEYVAETTVKALRGELPRQAEILADAARNADRYTWDRAAREMDRVCRGLDWVGGPP